MSSLTWGKTQRSLKPDTMFDMAKHEHNDC